MRIGWSTVFSLVAILGWSGAGLTQGESRSGAAPVAIRAGKILNIRTGAYVENGVILVEGERIKAVGTGREVSIPGGTRVIDLTRFTVLPGLMDTHTHLLLHPGDYDSQLIKESPAYRTVRGARAAMDMLLAGFTAIRDVETEGAYYADVGIRQAVEEGIIPGPRMQVSTRALSTTGNYALLGYPYEVTVPKGVQIVDGPWAIRKAVREQIQFGADWIKLYADYRVFTDSGEILDWRLSFTDEELKALVDEAHKMNRKVAAHAYRDSSAQQAIRAGVNSIEHGLFLSEETLRMMKERGVYYVPTLTAYYEHWQATPTPAWKGIVEGHRATLQRALKLGVKVASGSDAGDFAHGEAGRELVLMVDHGATPLQTLQAATLTAAEMLGWGDSTAAVEPGKWADLIALEGDPLKDIQVVRNVRFVMKGGQVYKSP